MPGAVHQNRARDVHEDEEAEHEGEEESSSSAGLSQGLLGGRSGGGAPLPDSVRSKMEGSFGADFSSVRVHQGPEAASVGARAFAQGESLHFAPGEYDPASQGGQELIGHELAHVVQQRGGRAVPQGKGAMLGGTSAHEREADVAGAAAARGEKVNVASGTATSSGVQFKGKKPVSRAFLDAARDQQAPQIAAAHVKELAERLAAKAELRFTNTDDGALLQRLETASQQQVKDTATAELGAGKQRSDVEALSEKISKRSHAVKDAVSSKSKTVAGEIANGGTYLAAFLAAARGAFDRTTVSRLSIEKLVIAEATASAKFAVNRIDESEYQRAKLALDNRLLHEKAQLETDLTTDTKTNVEVRAKAATDKRKDPEIDQKVTKIAADAQKPVFDGLHDAVEKYLANGLGANGAGFLRSDELRAFRGELKKQARNQARQDVDTETTTQGAGLGKATKRYVNMDAKMGAYGEAKESVNTHLGDVATTMTNKVLADEKASDGILDAARVAAFAVYEDEGHRPAAVTAATSAAKEHEKKIHAKILAEAKKRKNAIVKPQDKTAPNQGRTDIETGVVQQVKDDKVGERSVQAAIKGSSPEEGMAKLGHFFDFMAPERGDALKFKVSLEVPAGPGNVLIEFQGDLERGTRERLIEHQQGGGKKVSRDTQSLKLGAEIRIGYSGSFPGIKVQGALGFFMRSDAASTDMCMKALSYGIYRFLTSAMPPLANLWGGSSKKAQGMSDPGNPDDDMKDDVYRSELWAAMIEEQVFKKDKEARVDLGMSLSGGVEANAGVAKAKAGLRFEGMRTYDHEAFKKSIHKHKQKMGTPVGQGPELGDDQFDKKGAKERREAISGRTTGAFVFESEAEVNIAGQKFVFGLKFKANPPDWELEISGGLKLSTSDPADAKVRLYAGIAGAAQNGIKTLISVIRNAIDDDHAKAGIFGDVVDGLTRSLGEVNNITNNAVGDKMSNAFQVSSGKEDMTNGSLNHLLGGGGQPDSPTKAGFGQETTYKVSMVIGGSRFLIKVDEVQSQKLGIKPGGVGLTVEYEKSRRVGQIGVSNGKFHGEGFGVSTKT